MIFDVHKPEKNGFGDLDYALAVSQPFILHFLIHEPNQIRWKLRCRWYDQFDNLLKS